MRVALALCLLTGSALPVAAQGLLTRPESCKRIVTAQYDDCTVTNTFRCAEVEEPFWIESVDDDGLLTIETRNADHGSVRLEYLAEGVSMRVVQSKAHPRDIVVAGSGQDTIVGQFTVFGMTRPVTGKTSYAFAGEKADHPGTPFVRITFVGEVVMPYPMPAFVGSGSMLYSDALDVLIAEETRFDEGLVEKPINLTQLALSGDAGFGDEFPKYGCGELSRLALPDGKDPA